MILSVLIFGCLAIEGLESPEKEHSGKFFRKIRQEVDIKTFL